jgi:hypothetical protein
VIFELFVVRINLSDFGVELANGLLKELILMSFCMKFGLKLLNALSVELVLVVGQNQFFFEFIDSLIEFADFLESSVRDVTHGGD